MLAAHSLKYVTGDYFRIGVCVCLCMHVCMLTCVFSYLQIKDIY